MRWKMYFEENNEFLEMRKARSLRPISESALRQDPSEGGLGVTGIGTGTYRQQLNYTHGFRTGTGSQLRLRAEVIGSFYNIVPKEACFSTERKKYRGT